MFLKIKQDMTQEEFLELINNTKEDITELDCVDCELITYIPYIKGLKKLYCASCYNLTTISNINKLKELYLCDIHTLIDFPTIQTLEIIHIEFCNNITKIPYLKNLIELMCEYCTLLKPENIGYSPSIKYIQCDYITYHEAKRHEYNLNLVKSSVGNLFNSKEASGFTSDFMTLLKQY